MNEAKRSEESKLTGLLAWIDSQIEVIEGTMNLFYPVNSYDDADCYREHHTNALRMGQLRGIVVTMHELVTQLAERDSGQDAPGHCHSVPGIWDQDNGELAGKPCAWCALWHKAKTISG